ncbi:MAG: 3-dehydroquinate synthase [Alphaproteobacteria bacterium]|nr:3-dehydroquinate synthase [Alphaproteobacteria bacterium]
METKIVTIDLGTRSYDIYIGSGLLYRFADFVPEDMEGLNIFVITDRNVEPYARKIIDRILDDGARSAELLILPAGEQTKSYEYVEKVCNWLLDNNVGRDSIIVAVGGGVIGDLTGFCASTIMRGVPYVQVPTTLLSQVDSSVGGKTGINTPQGKNLIGSFFQPIAVIADIDTLKTLSHRQFLSGYAEVVKYGLINDSLFFDWLEKNGSDVCELEKDAITHVLEVSTKAKAGVVQTDEHEHGRRALLNLGHTFGHALETAAGYGDRLYHGEAVAIGIVMAFDLSKRLGFCTQDDLDRVERHFMDVGLPTRALSIQPKLETTIDELMLIIGHDKKVSRGKVKFILVNGIGEAFITDDVPEKLVRAVLKDSLGGEPKQSVRGNFKSQGVKGLWKSAFSSLS